MSLLPYESRDGPNLQEGEQVLHLETIPSPKIGGGEPAVTRLVLTNHRCICQKHGFAERAPDESVALHEITSIQCRKLHKPRAQSIWIHALEGEVAVYHANIASLDRWPTLLLAVGDGGILPTIPMPVHSSGVHLLPDEEVLWEGRPGRWRDRSWGVVLWQGFWLTALVAGVLFCFRSLAGLEGGSWVWGSALLVFLLLILWGVISSNREFNRVRREGAYPLTSRRVIFRLGQREETSILLDGIRNIGITLRERRGEIDLGLLTLHDVPEPENVKAAILTARETYRNGTYKKSNSIN